MSYQHIFFYPFIPISPLYLPYISQVSYQHIFFYPLMAFGRINLYAQATRLRGRGRGKG